MYAYLYSSLSLGGCAGLWGYRPPWLLAHGEPVLGLPEPPKVFGVVVRGVEGLKFCVWVSCYHGGVCIYMYVVHVSMYIYTDIYTIFVNEILATYLAPDDPDLVRS